MGINLCSVRSRPTPASKWESEAKVKNGLSTIVRNACLSVWCCCCVLFFSLILFLCVSKSNSSVFVVLRTQREGFFICFYTLPCHTQCTGAVVLGWPSGKFFCLIGNDSSLATQSSENAHASRPPCQCGNHP